MKKLYVCYLNHLDLTWRRPRYRNGHTDGYAVAPYSSIQELQIEAGLDFVRAGGCYDIEQAITLREYLERNPDAEPEIRQMLADGHLHILGGGESVIDYNLPTGEALVRNHTYALRWLKETFAITPRFAECPDTFGLSAGLPTLFTQLGYQGMGQYNRVFTNARPFWRGISGAVLPLATVNGGVSAQILCPYVKSRVCGVCHGEGCPVCGGNGYVPVKMWESDQELDALARDVQMRMENRPEEDVYIIISGEESLVDGGGFRRLQAMADKLAVELCPIGLEAMIEQNCGDLLERYTRGVYTEEEIDPRAEGNPVAAGCYTGRIRIKQAVRRCEAALTACERLASAAYWEKGMPYPAKAIERLWRQLQIINFHDGVPASHSDDAYEELMEMAHHLCVKAHRITNRAVEALVETQKVQSGEDGCFTVFNPLEFPVKGVRLQGVVPVSEHTTGGWVQFPDGRRVRADAVKHTAVPEHTEALVEFIGDLPAFGYAVFRFIPEEFGEPVQTVRCKEAVLENAHLRVVLAEGGVQSVLDKHTGRMLAERNSFIPVINDDTGHPWGRTARSFYGEEVHCPACVENMVPPKEFSRSLEYVREEGVQRAVVKIRYSRPDQNLQSLDWMAEFFLPDEGEELLVTIHTAFDALNLRLSTQVALPEVPAGEALDYEIPLGRIARGACCVDDEALGQADEWPALHNVCAHLSGVNVLLCNDGTPAHKLDGRIITTALLRNPTQTCCGFGFTGIRDATMNVFHFTLSAATESSLTPYRRGLALNTQYPVWPGALAKAIGRYLTTELPDNAPLLALKGAEDGNGLILRYLGVEEPVELRFAQPVVPTDLLEETKGTPVSTAVLRPYDMATFRW